MSDNADIDEPPLTASEHLRRIKLSIDWLVAASAPHCHDKRCNEIKELLEHASEVAANFERPLN